MSYIIIACCGNINYHIEWCGCNTSLLIWIMSSTILLIFKRWKCRFKLKEEEQFVIKLYYPFIINCCTSQFTSMVKSSRSLKNTHKRWLTRNSLLGSVLCPYCSPWYIISRRIWLWNPIELCNPSVADPEGAALPQKKKKKYIYIYTNLGFYKLQKGPFHALDFDIFPGEHDPGPL